LEPVSLSGWITSPTFCPFLLEVMTSYTVLLFPL
jgi:hypothetical protein